MRKVFGILVLSCLFASPVLAQDESVYIRPKRQSNVRADSTTGADILAVISADVVLEATISAYDWYKVKLPPQTPAYISSQYINAQGECTAAKLNIRKEPATSAVIIGKLTQGDVVAVMEKGAEWTRINAYPFAQGWISMQQVTKVGRADFETYLASLPAIRSLAVPTAEKKIMQSPVTKEQLPVTSSTAVAQAPTAAPITVSQPEAMSTKPAVIVDEKAERQRKNNELKKAKEEERRKMREEKETARQKRTEERAAQRLKEKVQEIPAERTEEKPDLDEKSKTVAASEEWDKEFKTLLAQHNNLKKRISEVMGDEAPATPEPKPQVNVEKKIVAEKPVKIKIDPATYADARMVGTLLKTRKRSIPANAMLKSDEGEQVLVHVTEEGQLHSLFGKRIAVWGSDITKDGYTYVEVARLKVIE